MLDKRVLLLKGESPVVILDETYSSVNINCLKQGINGDFTLQGKWYNLQLYCPVETNIHTQHR